MKDNEKKSRKTEKKKENRDALSPMDVALSVIRNDEVSDIITDPQGSWTGVPYDKNERPVQDADDL